MNKLTIFFICVTVLVIGVTGTLLGYRYFERRGEEGKEVVTQIPTPEPTQEPVQEPIKDPVKDPETDKPFISALAGISEEMVLNAGFQNPTVLMEEFDGLIFNNYDISEYRNEEHIRYLLKEGSEDAGTINELIFPSEKIAEEVYKSLKEKMSQEDSLFTINETGQYGKASFFANNSAETNSVFLVVKFTERLYTLHYPAKNHNKMKNLLQSI